MLWILQSTISIESLLNSLHWSFFRELVFFHTLVSEARLCIRPNPSKRPDNLHVQRVLILVLRVFQEWSQLHLYTLQQLNTCKHKYYNGFQFFQLILSAALLGLCTFWGVLTSFWVTVSMMVPKAGIVDILTELQHKCKKMLWALSMIHYFRCSPVACL